MRAALRFMVERFRGVPAAEIKARHAKECQADMVAAGMARRTVNQYVGRIARAFRWAAGEDLVAADVAGALESVPRLQPGRTAASDPGPVMSAPAADVERVLEHLHPDGGRRRVLAAMVRFMLASGCRPGELCTMTAAAIDRSQSEWAYRATDKNLHRQQARRPRVIWIGPRPPRP